MLQTHHVITGTAILAIASLLSTCGDTSSSSGPDRSAADLSATPSSNTSILPTTRVCPPEYRSIAYTGGGSVGGMTLAIPSMDGMATFSATTPNASTGAYTICMGTSDDSLLPATGIGARNYEVIGEGSFMSLENPTLTIRYATAGTVTIRYLPPPATVGAAYGSSDNANDLMVDRRITTHAVAKGANFVAVIDSAAPGLYMTSEPMP